MKNQPDYRLFAAGAKLFDAAMQGAAERVPVFAQIHEFAVQELGVAPTEFYSSPAWLTDGNLAVFQKYGLDLAYVDYDVYNIEAEALGQKLHWPERGTPVTDDSTPLVAGPDDLQKIKTPNFARAGRCPQIIQAQHRFRELTGVEPALGFCAPFSLAAGGRGIERLLFDIYDNPSFAGELFDRLTEEVLAPWILYQQEQFPQATSVAGSDATSSLPIVNLDILRDWSAPYILRLREWCGAGVHVPNWVGERFCRHPADLLDLKLTVTSTFIEGQDPDAAQLGPELYTDFAQKHNVPLILGIGAGFLALSTPPQIEARIKQYLNVGKQWGRFALYLCNVSADTPPENLIAAVEAVKTHGHY
jgi:uroporphyrinogen-III decarboxylase